MSVLYLQKRHPSNFSCKTRVITNVPRTPSNFFILKSFKPRVQRNTMWQQSKNLDVMGDQEGANSCWGNMCKDPKCDAVWKLHTAARRESMSGAGAQRCIFNYFNLTVAIVYLYFLRSVPLTVMFWMVKRLPFILRIIIIFLYCCVED